MPVPDNTPEPLKVAIEAMEATVQENKKSMAYAAPEMQDQFWIRMQQDLADAFVTLYETMGGK